MQTKLRRAQRVRLVGLRAAGRHTTAELPSVTRAAVYRAARCFGNPDNVRTSGS